MAELTREALEAAIRKKVAKPLFATLVGDHVRGWANDRSAYVVIGAMLVPIRELLGLRPAREAKERTIGVDGREVNLTFHDLGRALDEIARLNNSRALEAIYSPYVVFGGPEFEKLRRIARQFLSRNCYHDWLERAGLLRQRVTDGQSSRAWELLESARLYLTGIHLLKTTELDSNLASLIERYEAHWLRPFISRQQAQGEAALITPEEARILRYDLESLEIKLHSAFQTSPLPEGGGSVTALDEFLVDTRMKELEAEPPSS
jgi:predicted nucleotidyltransferase